MAGPCPKAEALAEYALSFGWTANVEYGTDATDGDHADVSVTWSDADGWAIGCVARWYRSSGPNGGRYSWRLAALDQGDHPVGGMAEWMPAGTYVEFSLPSVKRLRADIADRADLIAWLDGELERKRARAVAP